jgi:hypothetical protein
MTNPMDTDYPAGSWQPHKPKTWPWVFGTVKQPTKLEEWIDHKRDPVTLAPIMVERWIPAGTKVKIVMVSRFGDVGITDDLTAERNYLARVYLDALERST